MTAAAVECLHEPPPSNFDDLIVMFRRLRDARSRIAEIAATAVRERERVIAEIGAWEEQETKADRRECAWREAQIVAYLRSMLAANPDGKKSIATPYGAVTSRQAADAVEWDEEALRPWATANGYLLPVNPVEPGIDKRAIRDKTKVNAAGRLVTADGEVVPGAVVKPRERTFEVTTS